MEGLAVAHEDLPSERRCPLVGSVMFIVSGAPRGATCTTTTTLRQLCSGVNKYFTDFFAACFRGFACFASHGRGMLRACTSVNAGGSMSAPAATTRRDQIDQVAITSRHAAHATPERSTTRALPTVRDADSDPQVWEPLPARKRHRPAEHTGQQ